MRSLLVMLVAAILPITSACDGKGRKYPPGYTDDGIKFDEDGWHFWPSSNSNMLMHQDRAKPHVSISCEKFLGRLRVSVTGFKPLQQWPQPMLRMEAGGVTEADIPSLRPGAKTTMSISVIGANKMLDGISRGKTIAFAFDDQYYEIPRPPKSMRNGFIDQCRKK